MNSDKKVPHGKKSPDFFFEQTVKSWGKPGEKYTESRLYGGFRIFCVCRKPRAMRGVPESFQQYKKLLFL